MKNIIFHGGLGNQMITYCLYIKSIKNDNTKAIFCEENKLKKIFNLELNEKKFNKEKQKKVQKFFKEENYKVIKKVLDFLGIIYRDSKYEKEKLEDLLKKKKVLYIWGCWYDIDLIKEEYGRLLKSFIFPEIKDIKNLEMKEIIEKSNSISIHVRRGDYLGHPLFGEICGKEYYQTAIKIILTKVKNPIFYIFSNDIEWCKKNLNIDYPSYYIDWNKGEESFRDMQLMSLCKHNIIPNSSFSWWSAWLNTNQGKIIIAPKKWINEEYRTKGKIILDFIRKVTFRKKYEQYKYLIPDSWMKI